MFVLVLSFQDLRRFINLLLKNLRFNDRRQLFRLVLLLLLSFLAQDRSQSLGILLHRSQILTRTLIQSVLQHHRLNRLGLNTVVPFGQEYRLIFDQQLFVASYSKRARVSLETEVLRKVPRFHRRCTVAVRHRALVEMLLGTAFRELGA